MDCAGPDFFLPHRIVFFPLNRLIAEKLMPILNEHKEAIIETTGKGEVGWVLGWIKVSTRMARLFSCCSDRSMPDVFESPF